MIVTVLTENRAISDKLTSEHGLSLHIKTLRGNLLFDMGQTDGFIKNAELMGINLKQVDAAIISHGHADHGGGLPAFMAYNEKAPIYIKKTAFHMQFSKSDQGLNYIGLEQRIKGNPRLIYTHNSHTIDYDAHLFSGVSGDELIPTTPGRQMLTECDGSLVEDSFMHEQNLIIRENGKDILFVGCSHRGIVNIINHFVSKRGKLPDVIIGGLHLMGLSTKDQETLSILRGIGVALKSMPIMIYACHCTGYEAYSALKEHMNVKIRYLLGGNSLEI